MLSELNVVINKLLVSCGMGPQKSKNFVHDYWRNPPDEGNLPQAYVQDFTAKSEFLAERLKKIVQPDAAILEIGCNAGRNLHILRKNGFTNLSAIEISQNAVNTLRQTYPELSDATIMVSPVEDKIKEIKDDAFDVIFSMAVLTHVHYDSDWIFKEMARISPVIIAIEDEDDSSTRHFPRNYKSVFEGLGMVQFEYEREVPSLHRAYRYRAFKRA